MAHLVAALLISLALAAPEAPPPTPRAAELRTAITGYARWKDGLVDTEPDRAPADCAAPSFGVGPAKSAAATGDDGHGKKLYFLYAKDVFAYRAMTGLYRNFAIGVEQAKPATRQPVGQLIVKESWTDVPLAEGARRPPKPAGLPDDAQVGSHLEGAVHVIGERSALFVMMKVADPATRKGAPADTDEGWVYATLTPDGGTVTASGRIASCMGCHAKAPHDRLFGPKRATALLPSK